jgi:ketopantoate reductase
LKNAANVIGVCKYHSRELIKNKKILILKDKNSSLKTFECSVLSNESLKLIPDVDFILISTKNPVSSVVRFYYERLGNKIPDLVLSQNGFNAADDASKEIKEILGNDKISSIRIIRIALFNAVSKNKNSVISYSLPIRLAVGVAYGRDDIKDLLEIFRRSHIEFTYVAQHNVKNMEYSKLFMNLIGVPSHSHNLNIEEGFRNREVFIEEIKALKEYIAVIEAAGGKFLNFNHYPVKFYAYIIKYVPVCILTLFRHVISRVILKNRSGKGKGNLDEIDYYNGAVVALGEKVGVPTPINKEIVNRIKKLYRNNIYKRL